MIYHYFPLYNTFFYSLFTIKFHLNSWSASWEYQQASVTYYGATNKLYWGDYSINDSEDHLNENKSTNGHAIAIIYFTKLLD